jgi:hypothetical protein
MPAQSGLVLPVSAVDGILDATRRRHPDGTVRDLPAHVSLLYPFLPVEQLDEHVTESLARIFETCIPFDLSFVHCVQKSGFLFLPPEPVIECRRLASALRRQWPDLVPYGGRFGPDPDPHLTIAMCADEARAASIQAETQDRLPVAARMEHAWLVAFEDQWTVRRTFAFRGAPAQPAANGAI